MKGDGEHSDDVRRHRLTCLRRVDPPRERVRDALGERADLGVAFAHRPDPGRVVLEGVEHALDEHREVLRVEVVAQEGTVRDLVRIADPGEDQVAVVAEDHLALVMIALEPTIWELAAQHDAPVRSLAGVELVETQALPVDRVDEGPLDLDEDALDVLAREQPAIDEFAQLILQVTQVGHGSVSQGLVAI